MYQFDNPYFLYLTLIIPVVIIINWFYMSWRKRIQKFFSNKELVYTVEPGTNVSEVASELNELDVINNEIINIDDIFRTSIIGSKKINHIFFHQNIAYLSTDFGLVQLDIKKYVFF